MSGVERSGSGLRALRYNAEQAEIEKTLWITMLKIGQSRKFEEANFARIQGNIAKQQARMATTTNNIKYWTKFNGYVWW